MKVSMLMNMYKITRTRAQHDAPQILEFGFVVLKRRVRALGIISVLDDGYPQRRLSEPLIINELRHKMP